ncbi:glycerophosphodiester phosphodiesterase [Paenibacillaceae bacterium]|nr:glycerophosphodiester phosphodiesterase [Paenibacillaceae bacterium]
MMRLFKQSLLDFRRTYKKQLIFEYIFMLATSFIFVPINSYIFNRVVHAFGTGSLLNGDVYKIVLSYKGIAGLLGISLIAVLVLFIEFGVLIIISQKKYFGKDVLISDALITTLRRTPIIFGFGMLQLMIFLLFLIPFIESPLSSSLLSYFNVPIFFNSQLHDTSNLMLAAYGAAFLVLVYLILRWVFVLHYIVIEGQTTRAAIRSSLTLTKNKRITILLYLFLLNALIVFAGFIVLSPLTFLPAWLDLDLLNYFTKNYSLTLSGFLTYLFALLLAPLNLTFLTRLYYRFNRIQGRESADRLYVYRIGWLSKLEKRLTWIFRRRGKRYTLIVSSIIIYFLGAFLISYAVNDNLIYAKWHVMIAAHRGDKLQAPENSLSAVRSAIEKNVDAVEIDVQLTKDGVVVLNHDYMLTRVAGVSKRVSDMNYAEIAQLDIGYLYSDEFVGERIPTLAQVMEEAKDRVKLLIEIKPYGDGEELARKVVELIEAYDMADVSYIQSFDNPVLRVVRSLNDEIKIGQILYFAAGDLSTLDVDFYTIEQTMLSKKLIDEAHLNGREVWVWTVNIERNLREVLKYNIDGIITNYPEKVHQLIDIDL